jgi:hypothetical protein
VQCGGFSPDGRTAALGDDEGNVILCEVATGQRRGQFTAHSGPLLSLTFSGDGRWLASVGKDTTAVVWDLAKVLSAGKPLPAKLSGKQLQGCWDDLAGKDAARAYRSVWMLVNVPEQSLALIGSRLRPVVRPNPECLARLIAQLDDDAFAVRVQAEADLKKLGKKAESALRAAMKATDSAEARSRLKRLLARLEARKEKAEAPAGEGLRELRAVEVLERVGTAAALAILRSLAAGEPTARLTQEARWSLQRANRGKR